MYPIKFLNRLHVKTLSGNFDAKMWRKYIFQLTFGNESIHEISNDNVTKVAKSPYRISSYQEHNTPTSRNSFIHLDFQMRIHVYWLHHGGQKVTIGCM